MDDYNVAVLVDAKTEYTKQLSNILKPHLYEGLRSIYQESKEVCKVNGEEKEILRTFQNLLSNIPRWSQEIVEGETSRIMQQSRCDWLEDLITAVFVSHTKILTAIKIGGIENRKKKKINLKIPSVDSFIHKTYIELAREFWKSPYLFIDDIDKCEYQRNMRLIEEIIFSSISETIRKQLPVKDILQKYLGENYKEEMDEDVTSLISDSHEQNLKTMAKKEIKEYIDENSSDDVLVQDNSDDEEQTGGKLANDKDNEAKLETNDTHTEIKLNKDNTENTENTETEIKLNEDNSKNTEITLDNNDTNTEITLDNNDTNTEITLDNNDTNTEITLDNNDTNTEIKLDNNDTNTEIKLEDPTPEFKTFNSENITVNDNVNEVSETVIDKNENIQQMNFDDITENDNEIDLDNNFETVNVNYGNSDSEKISNSDKNINEEVVDELTRLRDFSEVGDSDAENESSTNNSLNSSTANLFDDAADSEKENEINSI